MTINEAVQMIRRTKEENPCTDCKNFFPFYCMDYDHVPERGEKLFELSDTSNGIRHPFTENDIYNEMAKCDLVCSNCHRARTFLRNMDRRNQRLVCSRGHDLTLPDAFKFVSGRNQGCRECLKENFRNWYANNNDRRYQPDKLCVWCSNNLVAPSRGPSDENECCSRSCAGKLANSRRKGRCK